MRQLEQDTESAAHWSAAQYDALFSPNAQTRVALVAADEPENASIQGFLIARCLGDDWEIENIIVDERHRLRGVGSSLVRRIAGGSPHRRGWLDYSWRSGNPTVAALRLYENIGFKLEGRRRNYYQDPTEDALLYRFLLQTCDKIP